MVKSEQVKGRLYIIHTNFDRQGGIDALTLTINHGDPETQVTILARLLRSMPATEQNIRDVVRQLGAALSEAAQSPQPLSSFPQE